MDTSAGGSSVLLQDSGDDYRAIAEIPGARWRMSDWSEYQERTVEFFRSLGLDAQTNVNIEGVRTSHKVDVAIRIHHVGFDVLWLVECKHWNTRISKLHILALREIVHDVGADRGLLIAERGFQKGALEAARLTNVRATSLAELEVSASHDIFMMKIREMQDRVDNCKERYWAIDIDSRIELGLRPQRGQAGYSSQHLLNATESVLNSVLRGKYPINSETLDPTSTLLVSFVYPELVSVASPEELLNHIEPRMTDLERRLDTAEATMGESPRRI